MKKYNHNPNKNPGQLSNHHFLGLFHKKPAAYPNKYCQITNQ